MTQIGCGLAGYSGKNIAPIFDIAPENCYYDYAWKEFLPEKKFWGTHK
jgi:hypothetical protein